MNDRLRFVIILHHIVTVFNIAILITAPIAGAEPSNAVSVSQIPLREGLTIVAPYRTERGDFEMITTVTKADARAVTLTLSTDQRTRCAVRVLGNPGRFCAVMSCAKTWSATT